MDDERESPEAASAAPASQGPPETPIGSNPDGKPTHTESPSDSVRPKSDLVYSQLSRREVLTFIQTSQPATHEKLMEKFGYSWRGAHNMLQRLRDAGLIEVYMKPGDFILTEAGERRIKDAQAREA